MHSTPPLSSSPEIIMSHPSQTLKSPISYSTPKVFFETTEGDGYDNEASLLSLECFLTESLHQLQRVKEKHQYRIQQTMTAANPLYTAALFAYDVDQVYELTRQIKQSQSDLAHAWLARQALREREEARRERWEQMKMVGQRQLARIGVGALRRELVFIGGLFSDECSEKEENDEGFKLEGCGAGAQSEGSMDSVPACGGGSDNISSPAGDGGKSEDTGSNCEL